MQRVLSSDNFLILQLKLWLLELPSKIANRSSSTNLQMAPKILNYGNFCMLHLTNSRKGGDASSSVLKTLAGILLLVYVEDSTFANCEAL
jgi:hypothetical protein